MRDVLVYNIITAWMMDRGRTGAIVGSSRGKGKPWELHDDVLLCSWSSEPSSSWFLVLASSFCVVYKNPSNVSSFFDLSLSSSFSSSSNQQSTNHQDPSSPPSSPINLPISRSILQVFSSKHQNEVPNPPHHHRLLGSHRPELPSSRLCLSRRPRSVQSSRRMRLDELGPVRVSL